MWTWGVNGEGQLGDREQRNAQPAARCEVTDIHQVNQVSAGGSQHDRRRPAAADGDRRQPDPGPPGRRHPRDDHGNGLQRRHRSALRRKQPRPNSRSNRRPRSTPSLPPATGSVPVTVTIPAGTSAGTPASDFSYVPIVTSVSPGDRLPGRRHQSRHPRDQLRRRDGGRVRQRRGHQRQSRIADRSDGRVAGGIGHRGRDAGRARAEKA